MIDFEVARARLVEHLKREIKDERVLAAMAHVPRERFVSPEQQESAYDDRPLSIGFGQTISQPYIVAVMTQALELTGSEKVLELGTGSGYQAAILGELARTVTTVERIPELAENAERLLVELGYNNVTVHIAKQALGWPDRAPYDAIVTTAAAPRVPVDLLGQLAIGGRLVIPVGTLRTQQLFKITRLRGTTRVENLGACRFVCLIGKGAWEPEQVWGG